MAETERKRKGDIRSHKSAIVIVAEFYSSAVTVRVTQEIWG